MATALERAFVRTTLGCIVLGVTACHGASKEAGVSPAMSGNAPAVAVTVAPPVDEATENDFAGEGEMQDEAVPHVVSMQLPRLDTATADGEALEDCKAWALTNEEAEAFFAMSRPVDARTFDEEYEDAPCAITGTVHSEGEDWAFSINGASKATLRSGDTVRYVGCDLRECEQFSS
jgi:hypothetical protein